MMHKALYFSEIHGIRWLHSNAQHGTGCRYKVSLKVSPKTGIKTKRIFVVLFRMMKRVTAYKPNSQELIRCR